MNKPKEFWVNQVSEWVGTTKIHAVLELSVVDQKELSDQWMRVIQYDGENGYKWIKQQRDDLMIHYKEVLKKMSIANEALRSISHSGSRSKLADEAYEAWVQTCDAPRPFVDDHE